MSWEEWVDDSWIWEYWLNFSLFFALLLPNRLQQTCWDWSCWFWGLAESTRSVSAFPQKLRELGGQDGKILGEDPRMWQRSSFPWVSSLNLVRGDICWGLLETKVLPYLALLCWSPSLLPGQSVMGVSIGVSLLEFTGPQGLTLNLWKALGPRGANTPGWYFPQSPGH